MIGVQPTRKAFGHQDGGKEIFDEICERSRWVCRDGSEQTERCRCAHDSGHVGVMRAFSRLNEFVIYYSSALKFSN